MKSMMRFCTLLQMKENDELIVGGLIYENIISLYEE